MTLFGSRARRTAGTARSAFHRLRAKARGNTGWNERDHERNVVAEDGRGAGRRGHPTRSSPLAAMRCEEHGRQATLEGNKAQEGEAFGHLHKVAKGTDSTAEQGLEGPHPIDTTGADGAGNGDGSEGRGSVTMKSPRRQRSQRCDTAAGEGAPSRGRKRHAGRPPGGDRQGATFSNGRSFRGRLHRRVGRNVWNPRIGCEMQQARESGSGANRRGRAKRRGRSGSRFKHLVPEAMATSREKPHAAG